MGRVLLYPLLDILPELQALFPNGYEFDLTTIADCRKNDMQVYTDELSVLIEKRPSPVIEDEAAVFELCSHDERKRTKVLDVSSEAESVCKRFDFSFNTFS